MNQVFSKLTGDVSNQATEVQFKLISEKAGKEIITDNLNDFQNLVLDLAKTIDWRTKIKVKRILKRQAEFKIDEKEVKMIEGLFLAIKDQLFLNAPA